jgi:hypothetical protein
MGNLVSAKVRPEKPAGCSPPPLHAEDSVPKQPFPDDLRSPIATPIPEPEQNRSAVARLYW